jgi:hypothetical protein
MNGVVRGVVASKTTAAGREYTALAFDVDIVKVGRGWGDEVDAALCQHAPRYAPPPTLSAICRRRGRHFPGAE